jgi:hypothetical protein
VEVVISDPQAPALRDPIADRMQRLDRTVGIIRSGDADHCRLRVLTKDTDEESARRRAERLLQAAIDAEGLRADQLGRVVFGKTGSRIPWPPTVWREDEIPPGARTVETPYGPVEVVRDDDSMGCWHVATPGRGARRARNLWSAVYELFELGFGSAGEPWVAPFIETCAARDTPVGKRYRCPCCDCWTLRSFASYDICRVCWWEDDPSQQERPTETGANRVSLLAARANYARTGAAEPEKARLPVRAPTSWERP